jgi:hypothetical protein
MIVRTKDIGILDKHHLVQRTMLREAAGGLAKCFEV